MLRFLALPGQALVALLCVACARPASAQGSHEVRPRGDLRLEPNEVGIGMLHSGATIRARAGVPAGYEVALVCTGREEQLHLKRKGKVLGVLWMSVGDATFERVPTLYMVQTSAKLRQLASEDVLQGLGVGYAALRSRAYDAVPETATTPDVFNELIRLKESEALYRVDEGILGFQDVGDGSVRLTAELFLPAKAPAAQYDVRLLGFKDGRGQVLGQGQVTIKQTGMVAFISSLALSHGLVYGILAVVLALAVGLLTGFLFGLAGDKGH